jgi:predicted TIM-barrel fold metal-dependent hydrolase
VNVWAADFARRTPGCVASGTFFAEPDASAYVADALAAGVQVFKAHVQVGGYDPRDPLLDAVWGLLAEAQVPVVAHVGSGPVARPAMTGPGPISDVLARHPRLVLVVAHLGAPEYSGFFELAARYRRVHLDTTLAFTSFFEEMAPFPPELRPRLADLGARIVLGSDFPNIPYAYAEQLAALARLDLGDPWLRAVCWANGERLLGTHRGAPRP